MNLRSLFQSIFQLFKRENPISRRFLIWYGVAAILAIMAIVAIQVVPMVQDTIRLNKEIQEGRVYVRGQNTMLSPNIDDFILPDNGDFYLEKLHQIRPSMEKWTIDEMQRYWDNIDQKTLKQLREENSKVLENKLQNLP